MPEETKRLRDRLIAATVVVFFALLMLLVNAYVVNGTWTAEAKADEARSLAAQAVTREESLKGEITLAKLRLENAQEEFRIAVENNKMLHGVTLADQVASKKRIAENEMRLKKIDERLRAIEKHLDAAERLF